MEDKVVIGNAESAYISQSVQEKSKSKWWIIIIIVVLAAAAVIGIFAIKNEEHEKTLKAEAKEISAVRYGATMPMFLNINDGRVVMFDGIGIWVYDLNKEKLAGYCDFRAHAMTRIQGTPCVIVHSTSDGRYVQFYWTQEFNSDPDTEKPMYLYDTVKDKYTEVENYDGYDFSSGDILASSTKNLSNYSETYELPDKSYLYYILDDNGTGRVNFGTATYGDLVLVVEKDGEKKEYRVFEGE